MSAQGGEKSIQDYLQPGLKDLTVTARVLSANQNELRKIKKDYAQNYVFDKSTVWFKEPFKLRVDSVVEDTTVSITYNGPSLRIKAPGVSSKQDITTEPSRRETALDFGLLVPSLFNGFFNAKYQRMDRETGEPVFDISYVDRTETAHYRVWIDPVHKITTKREWYNRYGAEIATFFYENPKEVNGVWVPTQITVRNVENKVAGSTRYDSIKVNNGLLDSMFSTGR